MSTSNKHKRSWDSFLNSYSNASPYIVPVRCRKIKGRNLCLYSCKEYKKPQRNRSYSGNATISLDNNDNKNDNYNYQHVKRKYFTNMYMFSKWSKFIRDLYNNDTLKNFANKLDDDTYILGIPASSKAIEKIVCSINIEKDQIKNPQQGSVDWIQYEDVVDAMDIANFLQIKDVMDKCIAVLTAKFPNKIGTGNITHSHHYSDSKWTLNIYWITNISDKWKALETAQYLLTLISYFENKAFDWYKQNIDTKDFIERILMAFLRIDANLISIPNKIKLFTKKVKPGHHAYTTFFTLAFVTFSKNGRLTKTQIF